MIYILPLLLSTSLLFTFDVDQWIYFKKIGYIHSVIEDDLLVHFITNNGIYSYDDIEEEYYYNFNLSNQINFNNKINHFYFDANTGMYWMVDQYGIKMKHSFHDFWSEISYRKFNIMDISEIINIGSSPNYIWIKLYDRMIPLDQITGLIINDEIDYNEIDNINWSSKYDDYGYNVNVDLSNYVIFDEWDIRNNKIINNRGDVLLPTAFKQDKSGNIWVGTDKGIIFKGSSYSHRLEIVEFGLKTSDITVAILDENMDWWFGDSQFLRTGIKRHKQNFRKNNYAFLAKWKEYQNTWEYIESDFSMLIQNIDVNDILSINNIIYIATMDGLLIFDQFNNDWIKVDMNLYDIAIWDIEYHDDSIYIATSMGFNEISAISNQVINDENKFARYLKNSEIYDILIIDNVIYIASEKGLFRKHLNINSYDILSDKKFKTIDLYNNYIFASDGDLWKINLTDFSIDNIESNVLNFSILGDFIWTNHIKNCQLLNMRTNNKWIFDNYKGIPGSVIYNIDCNNEKVWFMTNDGLAIYNWDKNDYE